MRKRTTFLMTMTMAAGLVFSAAASFAGGAACCAGKTEKASASGKCCPSGATSASAACTKSAIQQLFKDAPGTKTEFMKVDGGVALVVRAASASYVPAVQTAMMKHLEAMKARSAEKGSCATTTSSAGCATTRTEKASAGASCPAGGHAASTGATCTGHGTQVEKASASSGECPDWMKVLCGSSCDVQKTAEGVRIVWTAAEAGKVDQLRAAAEKLQADLVQS